MLMLPTAAFALAEGARPSRADWCEAKEDETPRMIAAALGLDLDALVDANAPALKGLRADARLRAGTLLTILPPSTAPAQLAIFGGDYTC